MTKNRYSNILRDKNQDILSMLPANQTLRQVLAYEFKNLYSEGKRALDLGVGEGDSAEGLLERTNAHIDLLDVSPEMIEIAKNNLSKYKDRTTFICEDAITYLQNAPAYDLVLSTWTIHNFPKKDQEEVLTAIYKNLNEGGALLLMEKVYPDEGGKELLDIQNKRFRHFDPELRDAMVDHENQDYSSDYQIKESDFISLLKKIGFKKVEISDRVEREVVLIAYK